MRNAILLRSSQIVAGCCLAALFVPFAVWADFEVYFLRHGEPCSRELLQAIRDYAKKLDLWGVNMCSDPRVVTPGLVGEQKESGLWVSIALIHTGSQARTFARHGHDCVVTRDVRTVRPIMVEGKRRNGI